MSSQHAPIIIIKKKKGGHGGHHGGAWKVAYADFVTAMMAFFLVMWLVNQSPQVKDSVQAYFRDPGVFDNEHGRSPIALGSGIAGSGAAASARDEAGATATLERAAGRIKEQIKAIPGFKNLESQIDVKLTADGLRIELQEGGQATFFDSGSAQVKSQTREVLAVIGKELAALPQGIAIEGHTDAAPFGRDRAYTNWELSADRANAARRIMQDAGLPAAHVKAIRGFADTLLRTPAEPFDPRNRRVSIVVQNEAAARAVKVAGTAPGAPAAATSPAAPVPEAVATTSAAPHQVDAHAGDEKAGAPGPASSGHE